MMARERSVEGCPDSPRKNKDRSSDVDTDEESFMESMGFLFESSQPTRLEEFQWQFDGDRKIAVSVNVADDEPGAVQSGHYLWPAASLLASYLVDHEAKSKVVSVVELGAGCGLASLTALQVWQESLQCIVITDHDPGTLLRARDNLETTLQRMVEIADDDDDLLNTVINTIASIPVAFESLQWGDADAVQSIVLNQFSEHCNADFADMILGSDLIYCQEVAEPLFKSAVQLMDPNKGRFLMSQSFAYDPETEEEIDRVCKNCNLQRTILQEDDEGKCRIQEFTPMAA